MKEEGKELMELKEYIEDVLMVLKKNGELEQLMSNLAEDSTLIPAKSTILDIEKRVVKDRLVELTEQYLGKVVFTENKEKDKKKRFSFVRSVLSTDTTPTEPTVAQEQRREQKKWEKEAKRAAARKEKQIRAEEKRIQKKQRLEAELLSLKENE